jgi:hypothetical protein
MIEATIESEELPGKKIRARPAIRRRVATCFVSEPMPEACVRRVILDNREVSVRARRRSRWRDLIETRLN